MTENLYTRKQVITLFSAWGVSDQDGAKLPTKKTETIVSFPRYMDINRITITLSERKLTENGSRLYKARFEHIT